MTVPLPPRALFPNCTGELGPSTARVLSAILCFVLFSHAVTGLALNVEFIDPDEARAAANASTAAAAAPVSSSSAPAATPSSAAPASSATSNDAPSLLIHAMRAGKRAVVCASGGAAVPHAVESDSGQSSRIGDLFKCTAALPVIYYKENERSHTKRARINDADNRA